MLNNFITSLEIMGKGMAGIFTVIIIIAVVVVLMEKLDQKFDTKK